MTNKVLKIFILINFILISIFPLHLTPILTQSNGYSTQPTMTLKIVYIGMTPGYIDTGKLDQILSSLIQGIPATTEGISIDLNGIGPLSLISWNFNHLFASNSYYQLLKTAILSHSTNETIENETGLFSDAFYLEKWIDDSNNYPAGYFPPLNGYTLFLANFTELGPHWYRTSYSEEDTGSNIVRNFQNSFGGTFDSRMFFIDLSVMHSYLETLGSDGPIQDLTKKYPNNSPNNPNDSLRIAEYFRDWIYEAIRDLFASDLIYSTPNFKQSYSDTKLSDIRSTAPNSDQIFDIYLINNITGKTATELSPFINQTEIIRSFNDILPWYNWKVNVHLIEAKDYQALENVIIESTDLTQNETLDGRKQGGVDLYEVYDWLFNQILSGSYLSDLPFITTAANHYLTFAFAFDVGILGISYKTNFEPSILGASLFGLVPEGNILSISGRFIPMVIAAQSYKDLFIKDDQNRIYGYTQLIIHENGHSIGLSHPHGISWTTSMVNDPMSYIAYSYHFSVFRKDQVRRGEINIAIHYANSYLSHISAGSFKNNITSTFNSKMNTIISYYNKMDYSSAYTVAWDLFQFTKNSYSQYQSISVSNASNNNSNNSDANSPGYTLVTIIGFALTFSIIKLRKKKN
ncbi:MAG: hypothetical protein ACFFD1_08310 [Candidatus Thorarchaeota archaeon]